MLMCVFELTALFIFFCFQGRLQLKNCYQKVIQKAYYTVVKVRY